MKLDRKYLLTGLFVLVAAALVLFKYRDYLLNPWTRDGQVRAQDIQITPRVSGPIVKLPILDNQMVKAGDLLFEIDPEPFEIAISQAEANLERARISSRAARHAAGTSNSTPCCNPSGCRSATA